MLFKINEVSFNMKSHTLAEEIRRALVICLRLHFIEDHLSLYIQARLLGRECL